MADDYLTRDENLYKAYMQLRKVLFDLYDDEDEMVGSEEFKLGFLHALKVMRSQLIDSTPIDYEDDSTEK